MESAHSPVAGVGESAGPAEARSLMVSMKNPLLHAHVKPWLILITTTARKEVGLRSGAQFGKRSVAMRGHPCVSLTYSAARSATAPGVRNRLGRRGRFGRSAGNAFPVFDFLAPNRALRRVENPRVAGSMRLGPSMALALRACCACPSSLLANLSGPGHHFQLHDLTRVSGIARGPAGAVDG